MTRCLRLFSDAAFVSSSSYPSNRRSDLLCCPNVSGGCFSANVPHFRIFSSGCSWGRALVGVGFLKPMLPASPCTRVTFIRVLGALLVTGGVARIGEVLVREGIGPRFNSLSKCFE